MNCDFSSNNNIWACFMSFCVGHFKFCWVIFIMTDWWKFCVLVLWQPFWTVTEQTSNFRSPHWDFALLNRYIFVYQIESHSECQYTHRLVSLLTYCCITIRDASPTLKQHWFNVLCLNRIATVILIVAFKRFQLCIPNTQYWFNTGPLSDT